MGNRPASRGDWLSALGRWVLPDDASRSRLAGGAFWSAVGTAAYYGVWFITTIIVVRTLGRDLYGRFTMVSSTVGMVGLLVGLGLGTASARYTALYREVDKERAGRSLSLSLLSAFVSGLTGTLLAFLLSSWLAKVLHAPDLDVAIAVMAPTVFFNTVYGTLIGVLTGLEEFRLQALLGAINGVLVLPVVTAGVLMGGVVGGLAGISAFSVLQCLGGAAAAHVALGRAGIVLRRFRLKEDLNMLWEFSLPALVTRFIASPIEWLARWMIVRQPGGYAALGAFGVARQWPNLLMLTWGIVLRPLEPVMSSLYGSRRAKELKRVFGTSTLRVLLVSALVLGLFTLASGWILRIYGEEYVAYRSVLAVFALSILFQATALPVRHLLAAAGRMWLGSVLDLAGGGLLLAVVWAASRASLGPMALAAGYAAGCGLYCAGALGLSRFIARRIDNGPEQPQVKADSRAT